MASRCAAKTYQNEGVFAPLLEPWLMKSRMREWQMLICIGPSLERCPEVLRRFLKTSNEMLSRSRLCLGTRILVLDYPIPSVEVLSSVTGRTPPLCRSTTIYLCTRLSVPISIWKLTFPFSQGASLVHGKHHHLQPSSSSWRTRQGESRLVGGHAPALLSITPQKKRSAHSTDEL